MRPIIYVRAFCFEIQEPRYLRFLRSLKENPDLPRLISKVALSRNGYTDDDFSLAITNQLLGMLPNLTSLSLEANVCSELEFHLRFLEVNPMESLKNVKLSDNHLTIKTLNKYLSIPSLDKLTIGSRLFGTAEEVDDTIQNSSLRILALNGGHHHTPAETVYAIAKANPKITSFKAPLFGTAGGHNGYHMATNMESLFSPAQISDALYPLQNSLEQLQLELCDCSWPDRAHDGTKMDLSMMNNLRILRCPSKCFFPPGVRGVRAGFYKLLPPNLEELTLSNYLISLMLLCTKDKTIVAI